MTWLVSHRGTVSVEPGWWQAGHISWVGQGRLGKAASPVVLWPYFSSMPRKRMFTYSAQATGNTPARVWQRGTHTRLPQALRLPSSCLKANAQLATMPHPT